MSEYDHPDQAAEDAARVHRVGRRSRRYLVAALPQQLLPAGVNAADADALFDRLAAEPDVSLHRRLSPSEKAQKSPGDLPFPEIGVFEMPQERAVALDQVPEIHVERDRRLAYSQAGPAFTSPPPTQLQDPATVVTTGDGITVRVLVHGSDDTPLRDATVFVFGTSWPAQGVTGPDGRVTLTLVGETVDSIHGVYVKPACDYWDRWLERPDLITGADNLITLDRLDETVPDFPARQSFGWGQQAMRLDRIPPTYRAHGVKIALIDSGVALDHPDLKDRIVAGVDLTHRDDPVWSVDAVGHGSHCAGIITGADNSAGIIGFAVDAEVHVCKIFPGGRFSDLIESLDYCIDQDIDVVNMSLSSRHTSALVARKLEDARNAGVACIAPAGNCAGAVEFPGSLPTVLTVAAMGKTGTYPAGSYHATQVAGQPTQDGYFSARFTCHGPEVDVCGPGVAVLSSVPPVGYAAWDGTSPAAAHASGLAALILAHHADFHQQFVARDAARVQRLFDIIRASCQPLDFGDPGRSGAGLPDAVRALGLVSAVLVSGGPAVARPVIPTEVESLLTLLRTEMERAGLRAPSYNDVVRSR